jgi:hypothetical protein
MSFPSLHRKAVATVIGLGGQSGNIGRIAIRKARKSGVWCQDDYV